MKIRIRHLISILGVSFVVSGCGGGAQSPEPNPTLSDAELTSTIIELFEKEDRLERTQELVPILRGVREGQGEALRDALEGLDVINRELDQVLIVAAWSKVDPVEATRWVIRNARDETVRYGMLNESVYHWALEDPESLVRHEDMAIYARSGWDPTSIKALVRGWYDSGKPNLEQFVLALPKMRDSRQRAASELVKSKLEHEGVDATIAWATKSMEGDFPFRQYVYSRLAGDIAKTDPERAIEWCEEVCDTDLGAEIPKWIATSWVMNDGPAAMNWITSRDAEDVAVRSGARAAYRRFLLNYQMEALEWVESLPEEALTERDAMQGPLFMFVNERSGLGFPEIAIEYTKYVTGDAQREELLKRIARRWLRNDPEAAEEWLAEAPLSEDAKIEARQPQRLPVTGGGRGFGPRETVLDAAAKAAAEMDDDADLTGDGDPQDDDA